MATNKALIVLQENSGKIDLPEDIDPSLASAITAIIDQIAETFEDIKTSLQSMGKYDVVHLLTDTNCTRTKLLNALVTETIKGRTIDLIVLGHGNVDTLCLHGSEILTGGDSGNIRTLLSDAMEILNTKSSEEITLKEKRIGKLVIGSPLVIPARQREYKKINLRMVYMCNCYGSTLNEDWIAIGAEVSVSSRQNDYMPEPMTTFFIHNWLAGQTAEDAAKNAYEATIPFYLAVYPPTSRITYSTQTFQYPCPTWDNLLKMCTGSVKVPTGVEFIPHNHVKQSELIVSGNKECHY
ncbi:hypothetical protein [Desulfobacter curvatus]|uniref:hypothetical protein n=1 Tax=Desulfobacter curvatus TaxID=2290 RepID=UPI00035D2B7A|nr:hypothetical protein [Desulfobacter curvatus]